MPVVNDFLARLTSGLPLTLIAILAIVVTVIWLFGGVGRTQLRLLIGIPWLAILVGGWIVLLYRQSDLPPQRDAVLWITVVITAASFLLPVLWRWFAGRRRNTVS